MPDGGVQRLPVKPWSCCIGRCAPYRIGAPPWPSKSIKQRGQYKLLNFYFNLWNLFYCFDGLAGNVGKCVCRLHPSNDRHFCLSPTCRKCRPNTSATFCYVGHFLAVSVVSVRPIADTHLGGPVGLSPPLFLFWWETQNSKEQKKRGKRDGPRTDNATISVTLFFQHSLKSPSSITMLTSRHKISPIMAT